MKIAVDAMGGDYAPDEIIKGAVSSLERDNFEIVLLGKEKNIQEKLKEYDFDIRKISILNCEEKIESGEFPLTALKSKKNSSIVVGAKLVKQKEVDVFISAGNSGAVMAAALLIIGCLPKLRRPAIATVLPSLTGQVVILDVGANVDCKPKHLLQFAQIGSRYAKYILKNNHPTVGLLNIGEEANKGNEFSQKAHKILQEKCSNFYGNIEGKDVFAGKVDVVVCDGFTGNILIKLSEGITKMLLMQIKGEIIEKLPHTEEMNQFRKVFLEIIKRIDYKEIGGLPLLGINGYCFICHGRSKSKAIKNAIWNAVNFFDSNMLEHLKEI